MGIPDPILVPILVLLGCAFAAGWFLRPAPEPRHPPGDPARCEICRATLREPWWTPSDNLIIRRRLARYVADREPGRSK